MHNSALRMDILKSGAFNMPHYGAKLHTAAICDLDDSPPNSLLKNKSLKPKQPRLHYRPLAHSLDGGVVVLGKAFPYPADAGFGALPVVLAGRSRGMEPAGPRGSRSSGLRQQCRAGRLEGQKS